jgi:hypothetical protein
MNQVSLPAPRLCLTLAFDLVDAKVLLLLQAADQQQQHDAAVKEAARCLHRSNGFMKYGVTADAFCARTITVTPHDDDDPPVMDFASVHNLPFDPNFHVASGGPAIRYEFLYDTNTVVTNAPVSKMYLRIVTSFGKLEEVIDGVTAVRIGLTAMEILHGNEPYPTIFPNVPLFRFGVRHAINFLYYVVGMSMLAIPIGYMKMCIDITLEWFGITTKRDLTKVRAASLIRFQSTQHKSDAATYQLYKSEVKDVFELYLTYVDEWRKRLHLYGYFCLLNFLHSLHHL